MGGGAQLCRMVGIEKSSVVTAVVNWNISKNESICVIVFEKRNVPIVRLPKMLIKK